MPYKKKKNIGERSVRAKKLRLTRRAEAAEARTKRLSADRARMALMRAEQNEEARALRLKKDREYKAKKRDIKITAEARAHRAETFRRLLSAKNTDNNEKNNIENVDVKSEFHNEVAVKIESNGDDELSRTESVET